jgi:23S rRNA pseudouridine955/2504/2580 synthase
VKIYNTPTQGAEKIITEYRVLESVGLDMTRVEITLHTGKTHQIRAHLAHVGCHIVGDMKYGIFDKNKEKKVSRQCLVAKFLRFHFEGKLAYLNDKKFESRFFAELS